MSLNQSLKLWLAEDNSSNRARQLKVKKRGSLSFCDNDYLGLAEHPQIIESILKSTLESQLIGSQAARLISGTHPEHLELEEKLATFKNAEAALLFPTGYMAALGTIPALVGLGDTVILDKLAHSCLLDGAKLSGAKLRVFSHNDLNHLEEILIQTRANDTAGRILIIVESLYSMDGDFAPLAELVTLKEKYDAWLMVDEAHSTGLFGQNGKGLCYALGLQAKVEVQMGTLSKAIGVCGGFIAGNQLLIQHLINRSRTFLFTTAPPPILASACLAALKIIQSPEGDSLRLQLQTRINLLNQLLQRSESKSPIIPIHIGSETKALTLARALEESGYTIPAIRSPTVPTGQARLRITMKSTYPICMIEQLAELLHRKQLEF